MLDTLQRPLRDLRISVTDRCNFRCRYCMPSEVFGPNFAFLPKEDILTFEEIVRLARLSVAVGVRKIRLTGGEPLLRRDLPDLVALLAASDGIEEIALTTNGALLSHQAEALALAGLTRLTVSLDALTPSTFARINGVNAKIERVLTGISTAQTFGLPIKINTVIQRGLNEQEILPLVRWAHDNQLTLRFIEFMDVGETNQWHRRQVVSAQDILDLITPHFPLQALPPTHPGETALRWRHLDGQGEIGIIASVTRPFCQNCTRLRLSADGHLFTCLFTAHGHDIRPLLRGHFSDEQIQNHLATIWTHRNDRYSELRGLTPTSKAEMSYLGG